MKFQIDANLIRAAMACQGNKDVRYYLNGFLLAANGDIVGTNGHVAFKGNYTTEETKALESDTIIFIDGKIPLGADSVEFDLVEGETEGTCRTNTGKIFAFDVVDGKYPNYERIIPIRDRGQCSNGFGIAPKYLATVAQVFGKDSIVRVFCGTENDQLLIDCCQGNFKQDDAVMVIMPCRVFDIKEQDSPFKPLYTLEAASLELEHNKQGKAA